MLENSVKRYVSQKMKQPMKRKLIKLVCAVVVLVLCGVNAFALTEEIRVTPKNNLDLTVESKKAEDGTVLVTIKRDLSRHHWRSGRQANLSISGQSGLIAKCAILGEEKAGIIEYRVVISASSIEHSSFVLDEYQTSENQAEPLLGGRTIFLVEFKDFRPKEPRAENSP